MSSGDLFNMLTKWCPDKLPALVRDAMAARSRVQKEREREMASQKDQLKQEDDLIKELVGGHCKKVKVSNHLYIKINRLSISVRT